MGYDNSLLILALVIFMRKVLFPGVTSLECGPPFLPQNGSHSNVKDKYTPRDKIEYSCDNGYHRVGEKQSICLTNGSWSAQMPFCDPLLALNDPLYEGSPHKLSIAQNVRDKNNRTCVSMKPGDGLQIGLKDPAVLQVIKLFLGNGKYSLRIEIYFKGKTKSNFTKGGTLAKDDWISFDCKEKIMADSICIRGKEGHMKICEVEVYGNDESSCIQPPSQMYVLNGRFTISREIAVLKCGGSKGKNHTHSICEEKKWKQIGKSFACEGHSGDSHKGLVTIIAASVVSVFLILGCVIVALFFVYRKRQAPVVFVMRSKEHYCRNGHGLPDPEEAEYASVIYSDIPGTPAQMRKFPKNIPGNLPDLLGYVEPKDDDKGSTGRQENSGSGSDQGKEYAQPQDTLPTPNNQNLANFKESSFYGE